MRFGFTDDQTALRDAVRDLLAKECTPDVVRAAWDAPPGELDRGVWQSLAGMGVLGVLVPEDRGGLGLDEVWLVPILEEAGRAALPHPLVETAMVAAPLIGSDGSMVTVEVGGFAPCWSDADQLFATEAESLRLLEPSDYRVEHVDSVDGARRLGRVTRTGEGTVYPAADSYHRGALGTAAFLVGLGQAMLDLTVDYAKQRQQFGAPIGSFQAVKHHLADALMQLEFARPAVYRAAWSLANGAPTRAADVHMAKAMASDAALLVGAKALQCHGAIGYTVEYDLHLYLKRAWALARTWGDSAWHRAQAGDLMGVPRG